MKKTLKTISKKQDKKVVTFTTFTALKKHIIDQNSQYNFGKAKWNILQ